MGTRQAEILTGGIHEVFQKFMVFGRALDIPGRPVAVLRQVIHKKEITMSKTVAHGLLFLFDLAALRD